MGNRKPHILVECLELIPSVRVGVLDPLQPQNGILYDVQFVKTIDIRKHHLVWADIFVTVRGSDRTTLRIVREAKRLGRMVVYYLDDDLLNLPRDSMDYKWFMENKQDRYMRKILALSDCLWGVNTKIKEKYLPLCGTERWIQNRVPMKIAVLSQSAADEKPVKILYAGSSGHEKMVREILSPAVRKICRKRGDAVQFTFVGVDPGLKDCSQVQVHSFFENYDEYHRFVEAGNFSIGLAVVRMDDFYQCKYYNKFVEYSGIGVVGVYTDCDLYRQIIEHGKNGLLCANTTQGWVTAIERLVDDAQLRRNCIQQAQDLLFREFQPKDVCESMIAQLPELAAYNAPQCEIKQVRLPSPELIHIVDVMGYLFRKYFILAVFVIAFKAIRRLFKLNRKV